MLGFFPKNRRMFHHIYLLTTAFLRSGNRAREFNMGSSLAPTPPPQLVLEEEDFYRICRMSCNLKIK